MFDFDATIRWITAVLKDPAAAALAYRETAAPWLRSFFELTLPLYVGAYLVAAIVAFVTGGSLMYGSLGFGIVVFSLLWALGWTFVIAFIFDYLSGTFGGRRGFDAAYAVVALAIVPAALGTAIGPLPWIGWLISLAASIYSLMLAYRFLPVFLEIPEAARVKHFAISIIAAIVVNLFVSFTLGAMFAPEMMRGTAVETTPGSSGIFGGLERQAVLVDAASKDTYDPPSNGRLSDAQVKAYVDVLRKTRQLEERLGASLEGMEDKEPSLSDVFSGMGGAVRLSTAEMEVVKTADGNWAEHQWVRGQLETARIQQDLNATTEHNYGLFEKYRQEIEQYE